MTSCAEEKLKEAYQIRARERDCDCLRFLFLKYGSQFLITQLERLRDGVSDNADGLSSDECRQLVFQSLFPTTQKLFIQDQQMSDGFPV
jgi:hypothetical protein